MNVQFLLVVENAVKLFCFDFLIKAFTELQAIWFFLLQPILQFGDAYLSGMNHDLKSDWKFLLASKFRFFPLVGLKIKAVNWKLSFRESFLSIVVKKKPRI